ncbi:MAG TPA: carbon-nitrogen family hydrolase [Candidatus Deferrimicrobiaceae bacterium]|jgi:predicted amidohydrolase
MKSAFTAAALQFQVDLGEVDRNARRAFGLIADAARKGAKLCVLPEMWSTGFANDRLLPLSGSTPGIVFELRKLAEAHGMVIAGSLPERVGRSVYNTMIVINANGVITGQYRKTHLFSPSGEHKAFRAGASAGVIHTDRGVVGPLICYDLRFPELSRKYYMEGATIFCVSAQWPTARKSHWDALLAARAIENQLFVVAANAVGQSGEFIFPGGSAIISPLGERLAEGVNEEAVVTAQIDPAEADKFRRRIPCLEDRNERAYRKTRPKK